MILLAKTSEFIVRIWDKKIAYLEVIFTLIILGSCSKEADPIFLGCKYSEVSNLDDVVNSPIPIAVNNEWTYVDTVWTNREPEYIGEITVSIDKIYNLDGNPTVQFNHLLPLITLKNDTLFSTLLTPEQQQPNCYRFTYPMFFNTQDSIIVDQIPSVKYVYPSHLLVKTPSGNYSNNIIFNENNVVLITVNEAVGIIKYKLYTSDSYGQRVLRRSLTLKSFKLH